MRNSRGRTLPSWLQTHTPIYPQPKHVLGLQPGPAATLSCPDDRSRLLGGLPATAPRQTLFQLCSNPPRGGGSSLFDLISSHSPLHHLRSSCSLGLVGMCVPQGLCTCYSKTLFPLSVLWLLPSLPPLFHCTFSARPTLMALFHTTACCPPSPYPSPSPLPYSSHFPQILLTH